MAHQILLIELKSYRGILLALIAIVLLYSGGLLALQNTMIIAALPFSIIIILMTISLLKSLNEEAKELNKVFYPRPSRS